MNMLMMKNLSMGGLMAAVMGTSAASFEAMSLEQGGQPVPVQHPPNVNPAQQPATAPAPSQPTPPVDLTPGGVKPGVSAGSRYARPFAFQNPGNETRFFESTRRLIVMEDKLDRSNQELLKHLGEVRNMPVERQNAALMEIVQQLLLQQKAMNEYLVRARIGWSGEFDTSTAVAPITPPSGTVPEIQTNVPAEANPQR